MNRRAAWRARGVACAAALALWGVGALGCQADAPAAADKTAVPAGVPSVRVGEPFKDFTAKDADGNDFTLSSLAGKPVLVKFFRGHW